MSDLTNERLKEYVEAHTSGNWWHVNMCEAQDMARELLAARSTIESMKAELAAIPAQVERNTAREMELLRERDEARDLIRTLWQVGNFGRATGNALSEDPRLRRALEAKP